MGSIPPLVVLERFPRAAQIRTLRMKGEAAEQTFVEFFNTASERLSKVESCKCKMVGPNQIAALAQACPSLRCLDLSVAVNIGSGSLLNLLSHLPSLKELSIKAGPVHTMQWGPDLSEALVSLAGVTNLTIVEQYGSICAGLSTLLDASSLPSLQTLDLTLFCEAQQAKTACRDLGQLWHFRHLTRLAFRCMPHRSRYTLGHLAIQSLSRAAHLAVLELPNESLKQGDLVLLFGMHSLKELHAHDVKPDAVLPRETGVTKLFLTHMPSPAQLAMLPLLSISELDAQLFKWDLPTAATAAEVAAIAEEVLEATKLLAACLPTRPSFKYIRMTWRRVAWTPNKTPVLQSMAPLQDWLTSLRLDCWSLCIGDMEVLSAVAPKLSSLDLRDCMVSETAWLGMHRLTKLDELRWGPSEGPAGLAGSQNIMAFACTVRQSMDIHLAGQQYETAGDIVQLHREAAGMPGLSVIYDLDSSDSEESDPGNAADEDFDGGNYNDEAGVLER